MVTDVLQVNFRIPADLKTRLEEAAAANGRSLTAELVHRLESTFGPQGELFPAPLPPQFTQLLEALQKGGDVRIVRAKPAAKRKKT